MKIKRRGPTGDLIIPKVIEDAFREFCGGSFFYTNGEPIKDSDKDFEYLFNDFWYGWYSEHIVNTKDKLIDREAAEFFVCMITSSLPAEGGYPVDTEFTFKDNGYEYHICTCGWTNENSQFYTVGYKEKIVNKGSDKK